MNQIKIGTVVLTNGSGTVRHAWDTRLSPSMTGTFAVGDVISWLGGGTGIVAAWEPIGRELLFARTGGPEPAPIGVVVTGPSGSGLIVQILSGSPPRWDVLLAGYATAEAVFTPSNVSFVASAFGRDSFTISPVWPNPTAYDVGYGINTDFTQNYGLPIFQPGNLGLPASASEGFRKIDRRLAFLGASKRFLANAGLASGSNLVTWPSDEYDRGGWAASGSRFVVPAGVTMVSVFASITLATTPGSYQLVIRKNGAAAASIQSSGAAGYVAIPDEVVVAGDYFEVYVTGGVALVAAQSFFRIRAEEIS